MNSFDAAQFSSLLKTRSLGRALRVFDSLDSSNTRLKQLAAEGAEDGTLVLAEHQSAGRGRWGRAWSSPAGKDLLFSFLVRPGKALPGLSCWLGLACQRILRSRLAARLKWPNDIWVADKKISGMLIEGSSDAWVVGIGLNVNVSTDDLAPELRSVATSLKIELGVEQSREALLAELCQALESVLDEAPGSLLLEWQENALFIGENVRAGEHEGRVRGLDPSGALRIETAQGERLLQSGEVFSLRPVLD